ncbi:DUF3558 domain-containing protein [Nocardia uniformis]|uniref:DUF3558 domain-containing protein n=1 Tax=Nocardia uniformis TaxID=53432 RepID=A0A849C7S6_9NOCA|nr:DUF3558 domain-containing protein [Nocardia uniformis]NNH74652.1 DUF3558 domain-containing protein [Nocardia uniformis]
MNRAALAIAIALSAALTTVGCSDPETASAPPTTAGAAAPGGFLGECGAATDDDIRQITGFHALNAVARNGIKCVWESPNADRQVMFTWFRGSPIERERTIATVKGKDVGDFEVAGYRGFTANAEELCQVAVQDGADFFHWMVYGPNVQPCEMLRPLAQLTIDRRGE